MTSDPIITYLSKTLRIVCDDAIEAVIYAPAHHFVIINGPGDHRAVEALGVLDEARAGGPDVENFLEGVEGNGGSGKELPGVGCGEADVGDGEGGQMVGAEGKVFDLDLGSASDLATAQ